MSSTWERNVRRSMSGVVAGCKTLFHGALDMSLHRAWFYGKRGRTAPFGLFALANSLSCATHVKSLSRHKVLQIGDGYYAALRLLSAATVAIEHRNMHFYKIIAMLTKTVFPLKKQSETVFIFGCFSYTIIIHLIACSSPPVGSDSCPRYDISHGWWRVR